MARTVIASLLGLAMSLPAWGQEMTVKLSCTGGSAIGDTVEVRVEILDAHVILTQVLDLTFDPAIVKPLETPWMDGPLWQSSGGVAMNNLIPPDSVMYYSHDDYAPASYDPRGPGIIAIARFEVIGTGSFEFAFSPATSSGTVPVSCQFFGDGSGTCLPLAGDSVFTASFPPPAPLPAPGPSPAPTPDAISPGDSASQGASCGSSACPTGAAALLAACLLLIR